MPDLTLEASVSPSKSVSPVKRSPSNTNSPSPLLQPFKWDGLPLSPDNRLFKEVTPEEFNGFVECENIKKFKEDNFEFQLKRFYEKWIPVVGYNTIVDCIVARKVSLKSMQEHAVGTSLAMYAKDKPYITPKHLIEINTRQHIHKAPLHGVTWELIESHIDYNSDDLMRRVKKDS